MSDKLQPMLLCRDNPDLTTLPYPIYATAKLDGIRCLIRNGEALSRTLKPIPNKSIQLWAFKYRKELEGFDGELIVGKPTDPDVYRNTNSFVMSHDKDQDFNYYVFDFWDRPTIPYSERLNLLHHCWSDIPHVGFLSSKVCHSPDDIQREEEATLNDGYEGLILRCPQGKYKYGRTTLTGHNTYKLKRFVDSEAVIIDFIEEMHNGNEAETNELGRTKRSTAKAGMSGKGTLGALVVREGTVEFNIGSGFNADERQYLWDNKESLKGRIVKYKHFPIGIKDKPRGS